MCLKNSTKNLQLSGEDVPKTEVEVLEVPTEETESNQIIENHWSTNIWRAIFNRCGQSQLSGNSCKWCIGGLFVIRLFENQKEEEFTPVNQVA